MKRIILILSISIIAVSILTSGKNKETQDRVSLMDFYCIINTVIPQSGILTKEIKPFDKNISVSRSEFQQPSSYSFLQSFVDSGYLTKKEADYLYGQIKSSSAKILNKKYLNCKALLSEEQIDRLRDKFGWGDRFYNHLEKRYGISELYFTTDILFNEGYHKAIIEVSCSYGILSGWGELYLLEKKDGKWAIMGKLETWIA